MVLVGKLIRQIRTIVPTELGILKLDREVYGRNHEVSYYINREEGGRAYFSEQRALEMHEDWLEGSRMQRKLDFKDDLQHRLFNGD